MKLFLISQDYNQGYDTYDSAVVCAQSAKIAQQMHPSNGALITKEEWTKQRSWCSSPNQVKVIYIGKAKRGMKQGLISSSFNAG